jgi:PAS domain S-box-containing protein
MQPAERHSGYLHAQDMALGAEGPQRDLSREDLERALRESEERFSMVGRYLTDVIWITDLELNMVYVSPSVLYQTGFTPQETVLKPLSELITPPSLEKVMDRFLLEIERAEQTDVFPPIPVELTVEQLRKDGTTFWSEVRVGFLRRTDGTPYGILGVSRDISERLRMMQAEKEAAAAQAASQAHERYAAELKEIIGVAAHELRLPATLFMGYARILREYRGRLADQDLDEILAEMESAAGRLDRLVANLLETSLVEHGLPALEISPVQPEKLMRKALEGLNFTGNGGRVEVAPCENSRPLPADEDKVVRILAILLDNALKYSPAASPVKLWCEIREEHALFNVLDRGPGIPEDERENVFRCFYRLRGKGVRSGGMGLGLYVARNLAEKHGGRIWVEPAEGGGSLFRFCLPLRQPPV